MSFPLSSISTISLSGTISDLNLRYANTDRGVHILSSTDITVAYSFLSALDDIVVVPEGITFLTSLQHLSAMVQMDNLTFNLYSYDTSNVIENINVDVLDARDIMSQYLVMTPNIPDTAINIIPLRNSMNIIGEYGDARVLRSYDGVYVLPEAREMFLQYQTAVYPKIIQPDTTIDIHLPDVIAAFPLSSLNFSTNGAWQGSCPANSDRIHLTRSGYSQYTDSGFSGDTYNGEMLCVWLSGNTLLERWYDPNSVSQGAAYITPKNSSLVHIKDVECVSTLSARNKFSYTRFGPESNDRFIDSMSANLITHFNTWGNTFSDESSEIDGFVVESYNGPVDLLELDGTTHAHIPPNDALHPTENMSMGMWAHSDNWTSGIDTQLWGNFSNLEGYGLFYNTGATNELITFPSDNGIIYGFNFKGYKVFEKNVSSIAPSSAVDFQYIVTDYFGARWLWDQTSQRIIKLESDDIVSQSITLPDDASVKKMQINSQNELYVLNQTTNTISAFDLDGNMFDMLNVPSPYNNFDIRTDDALVYSFSRLMTIDSNNNVFKVLGTNIYKNDIVWFHFADNISTLKIGSDDAVYVYTAQNTLTKIDTSGAKVFDLAIPLAFNDDSVEMGFVKEYRDNKDFDILWIIYNSNKIIIKVDTTGRIVKRINLRDVVNLKNCGNFQFTTRGDFTGFEIKRKYEHASSDAPAFSLKLNLKCGNNTKIIRRYVPAAPYRKGWVHLGFTTNIIGTDTIVRFYVNGHIQSETVLAGVHQISYRTKVSPFIIGGNSGRLGAKNVERSLNNIGYFKGKITDIRLYRTALDAYEMGTLSHARFWNKWQPITILVPTLPRTYLEKIEKFHLNKYPGFKSNRYNLKIHGINSVVDRANIESFIRSNIKKISLANTTLNEVIFV